MATVSCSWCSAGNDLVEGGPTWCWECGHRADVPRLACTCVFCRKRAVVFKLGQVVDDPASWRELVQKNADLFRTDPT